MYLIFGGSYKAVSVTATRKLSGSQTTISCQDIFSSQDKNGTVFQLCRLHQNTILSAVHQRMKGKGLFRNGNVRNRRAPGVWADVLPAEAGGINRPAVPSPGGGSL